MPKLNGKQEGGMAKEERYKYSGTTKDGYLIQSNNIEHFRLEKLKSFTITEYMTEKEIRKHFGTDYKLPNDLRRLKEIKLK